MQLDKSILILFGMFSGFVSILLGYKLFLKGIEGSTSMEGEVKKIKLSLRNASPGLFFALFGAFIIISGIYKPDIHSMEKKINEDNNVEIKEIISKGLLSDNEANEVNNEIFEQALEFRKEKKDDDAIIIYLSLLKSNPSNHAVHNNLAYIYLSKKKYNMAIVHAKKAIEHSSQKEQQASYYDTLARVYYEKKDFSEAKLAIQKAIDLDSANIDYQRFNQEIRRNII